MSTFNSDPYDIRLGDRLWRSQIFSQYLSYSHCDNVGLLSLTPTGDGRQTSAHHHVVWSLWLWNQPNSVLQARGPRALLGDVQPLSSARPALFTGVFHPFLSGFPRLRRHRTMGITKVHGCNRSLPFVTPHAPTSPPLA